jgi:hypothetical protein
MNVFHENGNDQIIAYAWAGEEPRRSYNKKL